MIVILKPGAQKARVEALMTQIKQQGVDIHYSQGTTETILGLVGDTTHVDEDWLRASDIVEDVRRVSEPYKLANRRFHPKDTHVNVSGRVIGEGTFAVIAGSLFGGKPGAVGFHRRRCEKERRNLPARRRV